MEGGLLPWVVGALIVLALVAGGTHRRPPRRKYRRARRFPRDALPGDVVRVTDGDGLVADVRGFGRLNIRLANVDAPEHDQPWGTESREALEQLVNRPGLRFRLLYRDPYARVVAVVSDRDIVLNEELVRQGHAWAYSRYVPSWLQKRYIGLERAARRSRIGLWSTPDQPVPPWIWRQQPTVPGWLDLLLRILRRVFRITA